MMNNRSTPAASSDRSHGTSVYHQQYTTQNLRNRNHSFGVTSDDVYPSTSQNNSIGPAIANYQPQWGRDPRRAEQRKRFSANTQENQREQLSNLDYQEKCLLYVQQYASQIMPCINKSLALTPSAHNIQDFAYTSTNQNRPYGTATSSPLHQTDRDPYRLQQSNTRLANVTENQRDHSLLYKSMFDAQGHFGQERAPAVNPASTERCITLDDDPIAIFGAYYMHSDWYKASCQPSPYSDLVRKLFTESKSASSQTGKIIIPTKYKSIFDDDDLQPFFPRHPEDSDHRVIPENCEDAQEYSKIRQPQQGCSSGTIAKKRQKLSPKCSDDQMAVNASSLSSSQQQKEKEIHTTQTTFESSEDQGMTSRVLLPTTEIGQDIDIQGEELIKTEPFLEEDFGFQVKEEVPWW
ncbi:uncharacterized protein [Penaeus vannamei]|uniref:uncharacterized protein n=1 Tax=Penaeus vannamei TaxID=6689 RepID=UPI00387F5589